MWAGRHTRFDVSATCLHPAGVVPLLHDPAGLGYLLGDAVLLDLPLLEVLGAAALADVVEGGFALGQVAVATHALAPAVVVLVVEQVVRITGRRHDRLDVLPGSVKRVAGLQYELLGVTFVATGSHEKVVDVEAQALGVTFDECVTREATKTMGEADAHVRSGGGIDAEGAEVLVGKSSQGKLLGHG